MNIDELTRAFPHSIDNDASLWSTGMTYRMWLAGLSMQACRTAGFLNSSKAIAELACTDADALIKELNKTKE